MWLGGHVGGLVDVWVCAHVSADLCTCVHMQTSVLMWLRITFPCVYHLYDVRWWTCGYIGVCGSVCGHVAMCLLMLTHVYM